MKKIIEFVKQCDQCNGTGIYIGFGEKDGFGVVCHNCKGTGRVEVKIEYFEFTGFKKRKDIIQVLETNPGISVGTNKTLSIDSFGGKRYNDWIKDKSFKNGTEMREFSCPAWWYQCTNYNNKPEFCNEYGFGCGSFSSCKQFCNKSDCWKRSDKELLK